MGCRNLSALVAKALVIREEITSNDTLKYKKNDFLILFIY
jgi:hypothetical protein